MHSEKNYWAKRVTIACLLILGMQFCFQRTVQASLLGTQQVDMISLGVKDPAGKPGVHAELEPPHAETWTITVTTGTEAPFAEPSGEYPPAVPAVLPAAGLYPSAP